MIKAPENQLPGLDLDTNSNLPKTAITTFNSLRSRIGMMACKQSEESTQWYRAWIARVLKRSEDRRYEVGRKGKWHAQVVIRPADLTT
jgi:hypothetical protein